MILSRFIKLVSTFFVLCFALQTVGQERPYVNYTTHNGLPQIQVREVFQDSRGYIWAGTKSGLVRFNGIEFTQFLPKKSIIDIQEDSQAQLYIKTTDGLYKFDGANMHIIYESISPFGFTMAKNDIWVWDQFSLKHLAEDTVKHVYTNENGLPSSGLYNFVYDRNTDELICVNGKKDKVLSFNPGHTNHLNVVYEGKLLSLGYFSNGELYLQENNEKYISINNVQNNYEYFRCLLKQNKVDTIIVNSLPVPYHIYFDFHSYTYIQIDSTSHQATKIDLDRIKAPYPVIFDKDNNIWAGSDNGLYQIINSPIKVYERSFMNDFWTIIKGENNVYYGAVFKDGLYKLDFETKQKQEIVVRRKDGSKETDYYYGASKDKNGDLYFPTHYGLVKYNYKTSKQFDTDISLMSKYDPYSNRILFGQHHGLAFIDKNENIERVIDEVGKTVVSHPTCFEFVNDSIIWVGTGKSLSEYNRNTKQFENLIDTIKSGPQKGVIATTSDHLKNIWLGGRDGLWLYEKGTENFERVDSGLIENNIAALISPNPDLLIIGTSREIYAFNLKRFYKSGKVEMKLFNYRNGFIAEEACQNGFIMKGNKLIIPSTTNTSIIDITQIKFNTPFSDVCINTINGKALSYKSEQQTFSLEKGENNLEFNFETIGFGLPTTPRFSYKLVGLDTHWSEFSTKTFASYANLSSGEYRFIVRSNPGGSCSDGICKSDEVQVRISIPFYREPNLYKYAFFVFLLLSLVIIYFGWSRFRYKIRVAQREQKIKYLEIATLQAQLNPHFIFNFLSSVQSYISSKKPEIANAYLVKFSRLMRVYMESSIKSSKVLSGLSVSNEISVAEEIDLLKMYIDLEAFKYKAGKINYKIDISDQQLLNKTIPPMIIQPLVENAIKHGILPQEDAGNLNISFVNHSGGIKCIIKDDGIGIKQSEVIKNQSIKLYKSRGIELINKKIEILNDLGYHIHFEYDKVEKGTTVSIYFNS